MSQVSPFETLVRKWQCSFPPIIIQMNFYYIFLLLLVVLSASVQFRMIRHHVTFFDSSNKSPKTTKIEIKLLLVSAQIGCDM